MVRGAGALLMPTYHRSALAGDLYDDLDRAIAALHDGRWGIALGVLDNLRNGPYPLRPVFYGIYEVCRKGITELCREVEERIA